MTRSAEVERLAAEICAAAVWDGDSCAWPSANDSDLYAGAAGVGWFLSQAVTRSPARRTAAGAARHVLGRLGEPRAGLYGGDLGALWCVHVIAARLGDHELADAASRRLPGVLRSLSAPAEAGYDVVGGEAGSAIALCALDRLGAPAARAALEASGERLLTALDGEPGVGIAHGASGIAWALLELHERTQSEQLLDGARGALAIERAWFDRRHCGWRDPARGHLTGPGWCRGAAGIGLVRLRALELAPEPRLEAEAGAAIAAAHAYVARAGAGDRWEDANASVCHGAMGVADFLLTASVVLGVPEHRLAAIELIERHRAAGPWACGTLDGTDTPGLMLGLSGIASVLLRADDPAARPPVGLLAA
jgi:lantibiotic modifying enzyme